MTNNAGHSYLATRFFFNSASVLLNIFINWASNVASVLLNAYKHHHTWALHIFAIFVSVSTPAIVCRVFGTDCSFRMK